MDVGLTFQLLAQLAFACLLVEQFGGGTGLRWVGGQRAGREQTDGQGLHKMVGVTATGVLEALRGELWGMVSAECHWSVVEPALSSITTSMALHAFRVNDVMPVSVYIMYTSNQYQ